jgi:hypothetical protein
MLYLPCCTNVDDTVLVKIGLATNLQRLYLSKQKEITDNGLCHVLRNCTDLEVLYVPFKLSHLSLIYQHLLFVETSPSALVLVTRLFSRLRHIAQTSRPVIFCKMDIIVR